jgi:hypothetical protein
MHRAIVGFAGSHDLNLPGTGANRHVPSTRDEADMTPVGHARTCEGDRPE